MKYRCYEFLPNRTAPDTHGQIFLNCHPICFDTSKKKFFIDRRYDITSTLSEGPNRERNLSDDDSIEELSSREHLLLGIHLLNYPDKGYSAELTRTYKLGPEHLQTQCFNYKKTCNRSSAGCY